MRAGLLKTFLSFLLFSGTGALFCASGEEVITYRSQSGVPLSASTSLRRFEQFLKEAFPKTPGKRSPLTIDITGRGRALAYVPGERLEVDCFQLERGDLELFARAGSAMLRAWGKAPEGYRLPLFICGAFRHRERSAEQECRFLGNNRRLNSVESLLRHGAVPELRKLLTYRPDPWERIENRWFDDHSRLLWELLRRSGFKGTPAQLPGALEKIFADKMTQTDLSPLIWGNFNPLPPELAKNVLDGMLKTEIAKLDHNNDLSSLTETVTASQLPVKIRKHPQRQEICSKFAASLQKNSAKLPRVLRTECRQLHDAALRLGKDEKAERVFFSALARLEKAFELYKSRSEYLDALENQNSFPLRKWKASCRANALPGTVITPECRRFLERMEEYYTGL